MATEKRLIDANTLPVTTLTDGEYWTKDVVYKQDIDEAPTVDAVPVDEIRVDIMSLSLENQEAVLNVSICRKPNEVKLPFCKEVAEVVHAEWLDIRFDSMRRSMLATCSHCEVRGAVRVKANECGFAVPDSDYCPNCGAKMSGGINR